MAAMTIDDAIARFATHLLTAGGRARATVDGYSRDLEQFAEMSTVGRLDKLDKTAVLTWLNKLYEREFARRSIARKLSALRAFVAWAVEYGHLKRDPIPAELELPHELYLPHAISETEVTALIDAAQGDDPASLRDYAMLETLYAAGLRVSELTALSLLDVHLGEGFATVTGKGNKQRTVPLGQYAIEAIRRYLEQGRGALCARNGQFGELFLTRRGPISRSQVFRLVKKYAQLASIKSHVSPHTLRHSCASHLLARGMDLRLVQELLGHSALATTQVYTHIEKSRLRQAYDDCHPLA